MYYPIDMISMLSKIIVKVPLSEMFRVEERKNKALSCLGVIGSNSVVEQESSVVQ